MTRYVIFRPIIIICVRPAQLLLCYDWTHMMRKRVRVCLYELVGFVKVVFHTKIVTNVGTQIQINSNRSIWIGLNFFFKL